MKTRFWRKLGLCHADPEFRYNLISKTKVGQLTINVNKSRHNTDRVAFPVLENPWIRVFTANIRLLWQIRNLGTV